MQSFLFLVASIAEFCLSMESAQGEQEDISKGILAGAGLKAPDLDAILTSLQAPLPSALRFSSLTSERDVLAEQSVEEMVYYTLLDGCKDEIEDMLNDPNFYIYFAQVIQDGADEALERLLSLDIHELKVIFLGYYNHYPDDKDYSRIWPDIEAFRREMEDRNIIYKHLGASTRQPFLPQYKFRNMALDKGKELLHQDQMFNLEFHLSYLVACRHDQSRYHPDMEKAFLQAKIAYLHLYEHFSYDPYLKRAYIEFWPGVVEYKAMYGQYRLERKKARLFLLAVLLPNQHNNFVAFLTKDVTVRILQLLWDMVQI